MSNASALFRSLLVYGLCLPLAVVLGYLLANPLDFTTVGVVVVIVFVLAIPLLLRWHHIWLIAAWNTHRHAVLCAGQAVRSGWGWPQPVLAISILQYTLNRKMRFLHVPSVMWPLLFLTRRDSDHGARSPAASGLGFLAGTLTGARRYFIVLAAVMGYFAIINRRIPPKRAGLYVALFFLGGATMAIANLPGMVSPAFNFLFVVFPVASLDRVHGAE